MRQHLGDKEGIAGGDRVDACGGPLRLLRQDLNSRLGERRQRDANGMQRKIAEEQAERMLWVKLIVAISDDQRCRRAGPAGAE